MFNFQTFLIQQFLFTPLDVCTEHNSILTSVLAASGWAPKSDAVITRMNILCSSAFVPNPRISRSTSLATVISP